MTEFISKSVCPITHIPVNEIHVTSVPVLAPDGWTYEKTAIEKWVRSHGSSPVTRAVMSIDQLILNRALIPDIPVETKEESQTPIKFVLAAGLDNSGSMNEIAEIVDDSGSRESHGLTQLDLAKHSLVATVTAMNESCMFGLVVWSTSSTILLPLTRMDKKGKEKAIKTIKKVESDGSTNLWEGIRQTQRICDTPLVGQDPHRCAWILTDGQPNYHPAKSYPEMIADYNKKYGTNRTLRTIGYGYSINSDLLSLIAEHSKGSFAFIPDPGFVGTVMVHTLANSMERSLLKEDDNVKKERTAFTSCLQTILSTCRVSKSRYGTSSVKPLQLETAQAFYTAYLSSSPDTGFHEHEVKIALDSKKNWDRWGRHYLHSLIFAHSNRECNNFKDLSVQRYQKSREVSWVKLRDMAHGAYKNLPAPTPSSHAYNKYHSQSTLGTLASYSQASNGCLHETALVQLGNGGQMACTVVGKGCVVRVYNPITDTYETDKIQCVVRMKCGDGLFAAIQQTMGGEPLYITSWHPVFFDGKWCYPIDFSPIKTLFSEYMYSFVLENRSPGMMISGFPCITLAAGQTDMVAEHEFWGTERVVDNLKNIDPLGWRDGLVTLEPSQVMRTENGVVQGFQPMQIT